MAPLSRRAYDVPPLELLVAFEAAARHLSFTRAGDEIALTQSAVSRQIQALEERLGVALFRRMHRALVLTEEGRVFQQATVEALNAIDRRYESYLGMAPAAQPGASQDAAAATASYQVLISHFPGQKTALDDSYSVAMMAVTDAAARDTMNPLAGLGEGLGGGGLDDALGGLLGGGAAEEARPDDERPGGTPGV